MIRLRKAAEKDRDLLWNINQKYLYEMTNYYDDDGLFPTIKQIQKCLPNFFRKSVTESRRIVMIKAAFLDYYNEAEICEESARAHYKAAIQIRNRCMVDRSDLVVCCIQHQSGGAYRMVQYAQRRGKRVIEVG